MPCFLYIDFALKDYLQTLEDGNSQFPVKLHYRIHFVSWKRLWIYMYVEHLEFACEEFTNRSIEYYIC